MTLSARDQARAKQWFDALPGQRGRDVPEDAYERIKSAADGITLPLWGRPAHPRQLQHLWDNRIIEPAAIHAEFAKLPHPGAHNVSVGDYPNYAHAMKVYEEHSK